MFKAEVYNKAWFGVRCIFHHADEEAYEERIILIVAADFESAIKAAEAEAAEYTHDLGGKVKYANYADAFKLFDSEIENKTEVFSLIRDSTSSPEQYISQFYDTGKEIRGRRL